MRWKNEEYLWMQDQYSEVIIKIFVGLIMKLLFVLLALILVPLAAQTDIFSKYYDESRKIAEAMTLDELIGQMIQADF